MKVQDKRLIYDKQKTSENGSVLSDSPRGMPHDLLCGNVFIDENALGFERRSLGSSRGESKRKEGAELLAGTDKDPSVQAILMFSRTPSCLLLLLFLTLQIAEQVPKFNDELAR